MSLPRVVRLCTVVSQAWVGVTADPWDPSHVDTSPNAATVAWSPPTSGDRATSLLVIEGARVDAGNASGGGNPGGGRCGFPAPPPPPR